MVHKTRSEDSHRGRLIRRYAAMLRRLASGGYNCEIAFQDGGKRSVIIATIHGIDPNIQRLTAEDPVWTDALAEAFVAGQMRQCQDLVADLNPVVWEQAAQSIEEAPRAGFRLLAENGSATATLQICFDAAVLSRALSGELQVSVAQ